MSEPSITCPRCGMTSYHPIDISEQYCGNCRNWHRDIAMQERIRMRAENIKIIEIDDGSLLYRPGFLEMVAMRVWPNGNVAGINEMLFGYRIGLATAATLPDGWDDVWYYTKDLPRVIEALKTWNYPVESEPMGWWDRHPPSGRRRKDGDRAQEYIDP